MKTPTPYQKAGEVSVFKYLFDNPKKNPLVVAPVSAGKSLMIAELIKKLHEYYPRSRVVVLTHVKELLVQNADELREQYPTADFGFYCAGLNQKRLHNDITFASIQSIHGKVASFNRVPEIIVIDECHLISHKSSTQYRTFLDSVLELNPNCRVIGYTGTPFRADTGRLDDGENKLFDDVCYEIGMDFMIEQGYWAKPVCPNLATKIDVSGVAVQGGDYVSSQLQKVVNVDDVNDPCIAELIKVGKDRKKWLLFTAGVEHAEVVARKLQYLGIKADYIHSKRPSNENDEVLRQHKAGELQALVNVAKLTTGYNDPTIDLLCFMRPTRSPVLYIQMIGRGVRVGYVQVHNLSTKEERLEAIANSPKPDCMIVDFGGVVDELGPIDQVSIKKTYTGEKAPNDEVGEAIMKICPSCGTERAGAQRYCYACSYCFIKLEDKVSNKAIVSMDEEPEWYEVLSMNQELWFTPNSFQATMKVNYATMAGNISEWICFEHWKAEEGDSKLYAWKMAKKWHKLRMPDMECPTVSSDAVNIRYKQPYKILAKKQGKYFKILDYDFEKKGVLEQNGEHFEIDFNEIPF